MCGVGFQDPSLLDDRAKEAFELDRVYAFRYSVLFMVTAGIAAIAYVLVMLRQQLRQLGCELPVE